MTDVEKDVEKNEEKSKGGTPPATAEDPRQEFYRLLNEGAKLLAQRRAQEAAPLLEKAYYLDPDSVEVKINLGGAYILQNRFQDAIPILEEAAEQAPDNPMVWTNLAAAYLGHVEHASPEQQEAAIKAFKKALEADPKAPHVDYNLGLIYMHRGDLPAALAHFQRALEVNPEDKDAAHYIRTLQTRLSAQSAQAESPAQEPAQDEHHEHDHEH